MSRSSPVQRKLRQKQGIQCRAASTAWSQLYLMPCNASPAWSKGNGPYNASSAGAKTTVPRSELRLERKTMSCKASSAWSKGKTARTTETPPEQGVRCRGMSSVWSEEDGATQRAAPGPSKTHALQCKLRLEQGKRNEAPCSANSARSKEYGAVQRAPPGANYITCRAMQAPPGARETARTRQTPPEQGVRCRGVSSAWSEEPCRAMQAPPGAKEKRPIQRKLHPSKEYGAAE